jgi:hypothetical protein
MTEVDAPLKPLPWSHSALNDFLTCPKQYYHKRIAKDVPQEQNEAGAYGDYVHRHFDAWLKAYANGGDYELPSDLQQYEDYLGRIAAGAGVMYSECKYAITRELQPCDFFAPDVWSRAILDVLHLNGQEARVIDHKTGKMKPDSTQLKLSALFVFAHHPEVQVVKTGYFWLKEKKLTKETYVRVNEAQLWQEFVPSLRAYKTAFQLATFRPRPSGLCNGWCPVTACEFWKPKRVKR